MDIKESFKDIGIELNPKQVEQLEQYIDLIQEWNQKINLTALDERDEIILKHFIDSAYMCKYLENNKSLIDVGSGAGFPGVVLKILNPSLEITLLDGLDKRVKFLNFVIEKLGLDKIEAIHGRAEEFSKDKLREKFDYATSRAVARLNILDELLLPFVKVDGKCIVLKSAQGIQELQEATEGINVLGGKVTNIDSFNLLGTDENRTIIEISKKEKTNEKYPRHFSTIKKKPL